jgi:nucleoside-diphosphate-sugar epimerase
MAEQMIFSSGFPCKIARLFHTYGPGVSEKDHRIFSELVWAAVNKRDIVLNSDGCSTRAFLYLRDATIAFLRLLAAPGEPAVYNVGNSSAAVTMQRLATSIATKYELNVVNKKIKTMSNSRLYFVPDCSKIQRELGWEPQVGYLEGFERTINYEKERNR